MLEIINNAAQIIWDYNRLNHKVKEADLIIGLGGHDRGVAKIASELYISKFAPLLLFTGKEGFDKDLANLNGKSEASVFKEIAIGLGVSEENIIIEEESINTGQNALYSHNTLERLGLNPEMVILVTKPYGERRVYATFLAQWPGIQPNFLVTSLDIKFNDYIKDISKERHDYIINVLVGLIQRIEIYPEKGFQVYQYIPRDVREAYHELIKLGYNKHLIQ